MAQYFGDEYNFGYLDWRKEEMVVQGLDNDNGNRGNHFMSVLRVDKGVI